jgi:signal transduction histidine kinase
MFGLRLRAKLLVGMFLILLVSIGLVSGQAVFLFVQDKSSYVFDLNASQAIRVAKEITTNVRHLEEKMRIFSDAVGLKAPDGVDQRQVLASMLQQYPEFVLFSERSGDGALRTLFQSRALQKAGISVKDLHATYLDAVPFETISPDKPFIARVSPSRDFPTFTLAIAAPPGPGSKKVKTLIAECPLSRLYSADNDTTLFDVYVTDTQGVSVLTSEQRGSGADGVETPFASLLPDSATTAGTREYMARGIPMLAAYAPVGDLGLWAVVQIPKARAFEAARRLFNRSLLLAAVVCLAALALVLIVAASITKPLITLTRVTEQIGQGQFDVQFPRFGTDEIGALGQRFKKMTEELGTREKALQEANVRLIESEKMTALGQLGAGIAHEVKNPLTSIRGYAQMGMRKMEADNPFREYFQTIEKETGRSLEILKNLLKFSRQETAEMGPIDLNAVVVETVKLVTHQLVMRKVEMKSTLCSEPLCVIGNANQIEQVLLNLFMNAGDAMESGGCVTVTTDTVPGSARIQVADNGSGIPPEVIKRIFNPFFTTKPVGKGTGLGLSVSYGIVKEHKGEITVQSEQGKGTIFTIQIPLAEEEIADLPQAAAAGGAQPRVINLR